MALKKRLKSDASLRPILAQYVPLELKSNEPEWSAWERKFPSEGNAIPIVYIVRADGQVLYGKSGSPDELGKFLVAYRKQAGAALSAKQVKDLTAADILLLEDEEEIKLLASLLNKVRVAKARANKEQDGPEPTGGDPQLSAPEPTA